MAAGTTFGVPAIDTSLGAIPKGGCVLLRHDPTVEGLPFLLQAASSHLAEGDEVVFVTGNRGPARLLEAMAELGQDPAGKPLFLVDAYSALSGASEEAAYPIGDPNSLPAIASRVDQAGREHPKAILLVDSLSGLLDRSTPDKFLAALPSLLAAFKRFRFAAALWTSWPYTKDVQNALSSFEAVVGLRGVEDRVVLHHTVGVERTPWTKPSQGPAQLFKVTRPGGIFSYIPKIVVIGPHNAGKTTFVHTVAKGAVSVERQGTTIAMDRGTVTLPGVKAEIFGTPGQERFDPLLPTLAGQAVAAILIMDATEPESFPRGAEMLQKIWRRGLKVVIALNKSDLPGALTPERAVLRLHAPPDVPIVSCIATDAASCRAVLQGLVDRVLEGGTG